MENLQPVSDIDPSELPEGFTAAGGGPSAGGGGGGNDSSQKQKQMAMQEQKSAILDQALSKEALARLGRIKLVKKEKAAAVENQIVSMAMQGKLPGKVSEAKLIEMLERGSQNGNAKAGEMASGISIQRKKYAFDSDDDDDNDDDLM